MLQCFYMAKEQSTHLRIPPHDLDAEKAVLGSLMVRPGALLEVAEILENDSFYYGKHGDIFDSIIELSLKNDPIDLLSVANKLKEKKKFDQIGGLSYLTELTDAVPSSTNIRHYAEIVQKKFLLRGLVRVADHIADLGFKEDHQDIEETLDQAEKHLLDMKGRPKEATVIMIKDALHDAMERFEKLHDEPGALRGVGSGFPSLDKMLSGFQGTDLIILAARPSVGKTTFALDIARNAATLHKAPVMVFSLEMGSHQLIDRMVAAHSKVDAWKLRTGAGFKREEEYSKLQQAIGELSQAPIFIDDQAGSNIIRMRTIARRIKKDHGLSMIVVDYLQLMSPLKNYDSMVNQVTEISRGLKALAKEFKVPVIALSQLSRAVEARNDKPRLSDLRDSGSIEQDADIVMFLHRMEQSEEQKGNSVQPIELIVAKHRNGALGSIYLNLFGKSTSFNESTEEYSDFAPVKDPKSKYDLSDF